MVQSEKVTVRKDIKVLSKAIGRDSCWKETFNFSIRYTLESMSLMPYEKSNNKDEESHLDIKKNC